MSYEIRTLTGAQLPTGLSDLESAPSAVYVVGALPPGPRIGVVGTRHPTREGREFVQQFARELGEAGFVVISGGAEGIDAAAHQAALNTGAGTWVIAPSGWDKPFPPINAALFRRVVEAGGAYFSEHPRDAPAARGGFFRRNAVLVSLSAAVVVVEAGFRSGARNAAKWARRMQRPLFVVPHSPWNKQGAGCNLELRLGAQLCTSARDVISHFERLGNPPLPLPPTARGETLPLFGGVKAAPARGHGSLTDRVRDALQAGPRHVDELCDLLGESPAKVQQALTELQLLGVIGPRRDAGG